MELRCIPQISVHIWRNNIDVEISSDGEVFFHPADVSIWRVRLVMGSSPEKWSHCGHFGSNRLVLLHCSLQPSDHQRDILHQHQHQHVVIPF